MKLNVTNMCHVVYGNINNDLFLGFVLLLPHSLGKTKLNSKSKG